MKYGFGIDLGGTTVKLACFTQEGELLEKWEIPTRLEDSGSLILPDIAGSILNYIAEKGLQKQDLLGAGIGVPGPVNSQGVVNRCINLGWGVFNVAETLSKLLDLPVKAGNDANVAALGEYWKGGGKDASSMVLVTLGTGVGGGIVVDGQLLHGAHGSGAEIGHMVLNHRETVPCNCGKFGCAEQYCSATGIVRLARRAMVRSHLASPLRYLKPLTCKDIFDAGKAGDPLALQVLDTYYRYLGELLANVCTLADPQVVVLGGGVSKAGQVLLDGVRPYFDQYIFHAASAVDFALAALGNDAGAYGAFKLILD